MTEMQIDTHQPVWDAASIRPCDRALVRKEGTLPRGRRKPNGGGMSRGEVVTWRASTDRVAFQGGRG